jgi:hypothetical protein
MSTDDELFTRSEVLGGFSAKRAPLLLFQIESRTCGSYFLRKLPEKYDDARRSPLLKKAAAEPTQKTGKKSLPLRAAARVPDVHEQT